MWGSGGDGCSNSGDSGGSSWYSSSGCGIVEVMVVVKVVIMVEVVVIVVVVVGQWR